MILKITDNNISFGCKSTSPWRSQSLQISTVIHSIERKTRYKMSIDAEHLNAMISRVSDENLRLCVDCWGRGKNFMYIKIHKRQVLNKLLATAQGYMN